ncbi:hypothetical protein D3C81_1820440 [compost metagenome]
MEPLGLDIEQDKGQTGPDAKRWIQGRRWGNPAWLHFQSAEPLGGRREDHNHQCLGQRKPRRAGSEGNRLCQEHTGQLHHQTDGRVYRTAYCSV